MIVHNLATLLSFDLVFSTLFPEEKLSGVYKSSLSQTNRLKDYMELPSTNDIQLLLIQSPAGLNRTHVALLKDLCTKNGLVVGATGRKNKSVKTDYIAAILVYVSM
jgi:hypothetical protein